MNNTEAQKTDLVEILQSEEFKAFLIAGLGLCNKKGFFFGDSLLTCGRNLSFLDNEPFVSAFTAALQRYEQPARLPVLRQLIWRKHILATAAANCLHLDGDFVECGVEYGFGVDVLTKYLGFEKYNKTWWLYDTFEGVPRQNIDPGTSPDLTTPDTGQYHAVCHKFRATKNIQIVQGIVPDSFSSGIPEKISFLHIDMNNAHAELGALIHLMDKVVLGGHVILDDYGWLMFARQHVTESRLINRLGMQIMELPTGQGLLIKTRPTDARSLNIEDFFEFNTEKDKPLCWPDTDNAYSPLTNDQDEFKNAIAIFRQMTNTLQKRQRFKLQKNKQIDEALSRATALQISESASGVWKTKFLQRLQSRNYSLHRLILQEHIDAVQAALDLES